MPQGFQFDMGITGARWRGAALSSTHDNPRPVATSSDSDFSLTIEDALALYAEAGIPRTPRSIWVWCNIDGRDNMTRTIQELREDANAIASLVGVNIDVIQSSEIRLEVAINKMVVADVVMQYTLLDEILGEIIIRYFLKPTSEIIHLGDEWQSDELRKFTQHVLDEMFLLKKKAVVHAIHPLPSNVNKILERINSVRNILAHSFFPENRKENRETGKVLYDGTDIRTPQGLQKFIDDVNLAYTHLQSRAHGPEFHS